MYALRRRGGRRDGLESDTRPRRAAGQGVGGRVVYAPERASWWSTARASDCSNRIARSRACRSTPIRGASEATWWTWSTRPVAPNSSPREAAGGDGRVRHGDPGRPRGSARSCAGPAARLQGAMLGTVEDKPNAHESTDTSRGAAEADAGQAKRDGSRRRRRGGSGRVLTDVIIDLGFVDGRRWTTPSRWRTPPARPPSTCSSRSARSRGPRRARGRERFGLDHLDLRPTAWTQRGRARHARRDQALPGRPAATFATDRAPDRRDDNPANMLAVDDIAVMTGYEVRPAVASPSDIESVLERIDEPTGRANRRRARPARRRDLEAPPRTGGGPLYDLSPQTVNFGASGEDASVIQLVQRSSTRSAARPTSTSSRRRRRCGSATTWTSSSRRPRSSRRP